MKPRIHIAAVGLLATLLVFTGRPEAEEFTESLKKPVRESIVIRQKTQREKERWQTEKEKQVAAYETLEARRDAMLATREALQKELDRQQARNRELVDQMAKLEAIAQDIEPFLEETRSGLTELLQREPALLPEERSRRLERLESLLPDPSIDIGEKYRKTMEALFIEAEYGNTVDTYQQTIPIEGQSVTATILRLGRLALFYQSIDASTCGYYDRGSDTWKALAGRYNKGIQTAIEIIRKQRPAQMVALPVGKMVAK